MELWCARFMNLTFNVPTEKERFLSMGTLEMGFLALGEVHYCLTKAGWVVERYVERTHNGFFMILSQV